MSYGHISSYNIHCSHSHREPPKLANWGSFQFSGPRKYYFAHVYWPKKSKNYPNKHFDGGVGAVAPILKRIHNLINKLSIFSGVWVNKRAFQSFSQFLGTAKLEVFRKL